LICPYPKHHRVDEILANLGEDVSRDDVHAISDAEEDDDVASPSEQSNEESPSEFESAVAANDTAAIVAVHSPADSIRIDQNVILSASQADELLQVRTTIAALESTLESLRMTGAVRGVQCIEAEIHRERKRERGLVCESPAVAEAFLRFRRAEASEFQQKQLLAAQMNRRRHDAASAIAERKAAVAELNRTKRKIQELESARACKHAVNTFTLDALCAGIANAGGAKCKTNRCEVLDRLSRLGSGLSDGQKNDFPWWKDAWDEAMVTAHGANWAATFAGWVQTLLDATTSNAFSKFMHDETVRVLHDCMALAVPGG